jgi:hypothetical protein
MPAGSLATLAPTSPTVNGQLYVYVDTTSSIEAGSWLVTLSATAFGKTPQQAAASGPVTVQ